MNRQIAIFAAAAFAGLMASSCSIDEDRMRQSETLIVDGRELSSQGFIQGKVRLRLTEEMVAELQVNTDADGNVKSTNVKSVNDALSTLRVTRLERTFPDNGFPERTREAGLHLWYDVYFDESMPLTRAGEEFSDIVGIDYVEYQPKITHYKGRIVPDWGNKEGKPSVEVKSAATDIFNDPLLKEQWHYYNDGTYNSICEAGADINVVPAWRRGIVGDRYANNNTEVIVAVVDEGVDTKHEDLAANMWVGSDGSNGYNFVRNTTNITAMSHGTHVAGTVAAVNNNSKGVCGVAGGDAAKGIPGARIMSCQTFDGEDQASGSVAIKWAADRGAVIAQNSWGYNDESGVTQATPSDKAAIDYFVQYAGKDARGNQAGPMAGGVVIFAAGNSSSSVYGAPANYEPCIAVSSIAGDYQPATYTNYGDWCDIIAPGGQWAKGTPIYSTLPGSDYGGMEGTSMACPHVSGVAALLVAFYGGPGFTAEQLRTILEESARDITAYTGRGLYLGKGLVDVDRALASASTVAPDQIDDFKVSTRSNFILYSCTVPADEDDTVPSYIDVYYSPTAIDVEDSLAINALPKVEIALPDGASVGDPISGEIGDLEFNTTYYVAAAARDFAHNRAKLTAPVQLQTGSNHAPTIEAVEGTDFEVKSHETLMVNFKMFDEDGHVLTGELDESVEGVALNKINDSTLSLVFRGPMMAAGTGVLSFTVSDPYGLKASLDVTYEVVPNTAPEKLKEIEDMIFASPDSDDQVINLSEYFTDADGESLTYSATMTDADGKTNNSVVYMTLTGDRYNVRPRQAGAVRVTITAMDASAEQVSSTFNVLVRTGATMVDTYPNPCVDNITVSLPEEVSGATVQVRSQSGKVVYTQTGLDMGPFNPLSIDLSDQPAGIYAVTVSYMKNNEEVKFTYNISKL